MLGKLRQYLVLPVVLLAAIAPAYGFDRISEHAERLGRVDFQIRGLSQTSPKGPSGLSADLGDTPISESVAPARFYQDNSSVLYHKSGLWLVAWRDERQGASKIYLEAIDTSGVHRGGNLLLAGSNTGADYVEPKLAVDTSGHIYLFLRDRTNGLILAKVYGNYQSAPFREFLINDTGMNSFAGPYDADVYPDGRTVVVWENYAPDSSAIALKIYNPDGSVFLSQTTVNTGRTAVSRWVPAVAVAPAGGFVVAWEDYRNGQADVYARLYGAGGTPLGSDFTVVPPPADLADQYAPRVAFSSADKFLIGWIDRRNGQQVYVQRYDLFLGRIGDNRLISPVDPAVVNWNLDLAVSPSGRFIASWASFGSRNEIVAVKFGAGAVPAGASSRINGSDAGRRWEPSLKYSPSYRLGAGWTEVADDDPDIHFALLDSSLNTLAAEVMLNDDSLGAPSTDPTVVSTSEWWNLVAFVDRRKDAGDIYMQAIANNGNKAGGNVRVNQDGGRYLQSEPALAAGGAKALVAWVDSRDVNGVPGQRIFGRYCSVWGIFSDSEFTISDPAQTSVKTCPVVALNSAGRGLASWVDSHGTAPAVYGRWLTAGGLPDGGEFLISNPLTDSGSADLHLAVDGSDRYYVIWLDQKGASPAIKVKWFQADGTSGGSFTWTPGPPGVFVDDIAAAVSPQGLISILWVGLDASTRLYLAVLDRSGSVPVGPLVVSDDPSAVPAEPALSIDRGGYHSAVWVDRLTRRVMCQILTDELQKVGVNEAVSQSSPELMLSPTTWASRGLAWFAWVDPRADGLNVWAANLLYLPTDAAEEDRNVLPKSFLLEQNYPNPFNPSTEIRFTLPYKADVSLVVYNLLGREVRILAEGGFEAGAHSVRWDGKDASGSPSASGVYFYRLQSAKFSQTKKMVLLK